MEAGLSSSASSGGEQTGLHRLGEQLDRLLVTQTTKTVSDADVAEPREKVSSSPELSLHPIDNGRTRTRSS